MLTAPAGICCTMASTPGSSSSDCTQPRAPPSSAVCDWLNCAATIANGAPSCSCLITVCAKDSASWSCFGSSTGMKISLMSYSACPTSRLSASSRCLMSRLEMRARSPSASRSTWVQPSCTRIWSISVVSEDAVLLQMIAQRVRLHAVALFDIADGTGDLLRRDDDATGLDLLHTQTFVDQLAGDLRTQPRLGLGRDRQAGREREQPASVVHVAPGDDIAVHHGDDRILRDRAVLGLVVGSRLVPPWLVRNRVRMRARVRGPRMPAGRWLPASGGKISGAWMMVSFATLHAVSSR